MPPSVTPDDARTEGAPPGAVPAVVLFSGGLDSTTTARIAQREGFLVHAITFRYGQRHDVEIAAARHLSQAMRFATHRVFDLDPAAFHGSSLTDRSLAIPKGRAESEIAGSGIPSTYVPARNTIFLSFALACCEVLGAENIFIGVNALDYSGYPDCRPEFLAAFERLAQLATRTGVEEGRRIRVRAPLLELSKAQIVRRAVELGVDIAKTWSCYDPNPDGLACGCCDSCLLRKKGFLEAGVGDPTPYVR